MNRGNEYTISRVAANFGIKEIALWGSITALSVPFGYFVGLLCLFFMFWLID